MDILIILCLTLLNAVFAMSEMALATSRKARLEALSETGNAGAKTALALMEQPTQFLSTVQVGITSISVLSGIVGEAAFSPVVEGWLVGFGMPSGSAGVFATVVVVAAITFFSIIFGELVPKRIGQVFPELVSSWVARPMNALASIARPFVALLSMTTTAVLRILPIDFNATRKVTEEEIAASLEEGVDAGLIEEQEHQLVQNVFELDDRVLSSIMVPRDDITWLESQLTVREAFAQLTASMVQENEDHMHSWYPVCKEELDQVMGVVHVGQLVLEVQKNPERCLEEIADAATFVPETLSGMELLEQFRTQVGRMVFVVDEYGELQGLLTPRDLLEAITGELKADDHEEAWAYQQEDMSWVFDGVIPANELKTRLEIDALPDEDEERYNTLAGLLMYISGALPELHQKIIMNEWEFEVVALEGKRIAQVIARKKNSKHINNFL